MLGKNHKIMSEINVTPFVDVMLVLLVVFIISAPMLMPTVEVDLPVVKTDIQTAAKSTEVIVSVSKEGQIYVQDLPIKLQDLKEKILSKTGLNQAKIFIRGDKKAHYEVIVSVLSNLRNSGFRDISLITENP